MQKLEKFLTLYPEKAFFILLLFALPAFFTNLGLLPLFADEPTRANVALEMILSGNYAVPTIGGEYYYNKPPLYNWILAAFYQLTGSYSEFVTRLPAIIPMFLFAITIFYSISYFIKDRQVALISAMLFLLNGRMLIYDSMLGHIDIFYSWLTFGSFMLIFYFYKREKWFWLFFISYLITALTFLCKGLPSLVFQGLTLIALLGYTQNLLKLLSWQHILSGILCVLIIGAYFLNYYQFNPNLEGYLSTIWNQSSKRTAAEFGLVPTILHMISFPFEHIGHLFPASILLLFCFHKDFIPGIKNNPFLKYVAIIFLANIWVYWLSPQTRPRYLLMLYPLLFILWSHAYSIYRDRLPKINKVFGNILLVLSILVTFAVPGALLFDLSIYVPYLELKAIVVFLTCILFTWLIYRFQTHKLLGFMGLLLAVRLAFSFFVLPHRAHHKIENKYKDAAIEMGSISKGKSFYFYQYHPDEANIPFHDRLIFYIERTRMQKVKFTEDKTKPGYYFTFDRDLNDPDALLIKNYQNLKLYEVK
ncbi:ArnT family glycosyltransferase [Daejeonella sp.]|uniref:ArnT family glycosyltransferase n=1 Tax=Daejeonella sp. TaxID=2805397 RepID=UPI003983408C